MAVSVVAGSVVGAASSTSITKPTSTGYTETTNDVIIVSLSSGGASTAPTAPTGFTNIATLTSGSGAGVQYTTLAYKLDSGAESWPKNWTSGTGSGFDTWNCVILRGNDTSSPIDANDNANNGTGGGTTLSLAALTATVTGDALVIFVVDENDVDVATWPTGVTKYADASNGTGNGMVAGTKTSLASGSTGSLTTTTNASPGTAQAFGILVKAASSGGTNHGSATILGSGGVLGGLAGLGGILGGLAGFGAAVQGLAGAGAAGGGLAGVGNVTASSTALDSATLKGAGALGEGVAGSGGLNRGLSGSGSLGGGLAGAGAVGTGLAGQGILQAASQALAQAVLEGIGSLGGNLFGGVGILPPPSGGLAGGAIHGAATLLGMGAMLLGFGGHGDISARSAATPTQTLKGSGALGGGFSGSGTVSPRSAATPGITFEGEGALGTGQAGSGSLTASSAATPRITFGGMGALLAGLFAGQGILPPPAATITGQIVGVFRWLYTAAYNVLQQAYVARNEQTLSFGNAFNFFGQAFAPRQEQTMVFGGTAYLLMTFVREPDIMVTPNSTIQVVMTAKKYDGTLMSNLATVTAVVTFPDGTVSPTYSLGSGITNTGSGTYTLTYTTKMAGENVEDWHGTDASGNTAEFHNITPVSF